MKNGVIFATTIDDKDLQVTVLADGTLSFSSRDEWWGDSESGFGATVELPLQRDDVCALCIALVKWIQSTEAGR